MSPGPEAAASKIRRSIRLTYQGTGWNATPAQADPVEPVSTSGGTIHWTNNANDSVSASYSFPTAHSLYLGTRYVTAGGSVSVVVDGGAPAAFQLAVSGEDVQVRKLIGQFTGGPHQVTVTDTGAASALFYFDFFEIALPTPNLPDLPAIPTTTLATDWDTLHSQALAPERTAWIIQKLGFQGRANHYAGALWFYELTQPAQQYASPLLRSAARHRSANHANLTRSYAGQSRQSDRRHSADYRHCFCVNRQCRLYRCVGRSHWRGLNHYRPRHGNSG